MTNREEFDALAERILHSLILSPRSVGRPCAEAAVGMADDFLHELRKRHEAVRSIDGLTAEEQDALDDGNVIQCIRLVRERTGAGLKEAKAHVDQMRKQLDL